MTLLLPLSLALALTRAASVEPPDSLVLAGGCYWGVEAVFEHVRGVTGVVAGFATPAAGGPTAASARPGHEGYAEAVRISFDPAQVTREQLLEVFFSVAHDPTQLDRQGPDVGPQYRSAIFVEVDEDHRTARTYLERLRASDAFDRPIVTEVATLGSFQLAPPDQQDFVARNPTSLYVLINDLPKLEHLRQRFPELYREARTKIDGAR